MATRRNVITFAWFLFLTSITYATPQAPVRLPVVATFSILADFARNVGGERIEVEALVGPNGDAHVYQPAPGDARRLHAVQLILANGLGLEGWIERLIAASGTKAPVVIASSGITPRKMEEDGRIGQDPHAWQTIGNAKIYVVNIRDGLIAADPDGEAAYRANAEAYLARLSGLQTEVLAELAKIPAAQRQVITTHDAFGYFGEAYGFQFIAPSGVSTETEASARDVAKIIRQIKNEKIPAVFLENVTDPRAMRRIADESGAKIGGALFSDALSAPGGPAPTYINMMRYNIKQLTAALIN